ncbi:hypothetical protein [Actinokineospora diospyrosa]|uniref:Secreted protein n=1 Tax=Actinokineospora diospyrosa TaxID=103728 RepID=A0ABT1IJC8_9PSEU|nr:hypothetical protein [Actinokineospora diospyrosa]MCP2272659.1 hypothetical protein [Actinokineospora diospyrosa]
MTVLSRVVGGLLVAVAASVATAGSALADGGVDLNFGVGVNAANNWNFSAASVCFQELAVVPVGGEWSGNTTNHCVNGNVLNHSGR